MDLDAPQCSVDFARLADPMKDVITCERGGMVFDGVDVAGMAETTPTPFFLFSAAQIDRNIAALRDSFRRYPPGDARLLRQQGVLQPVVPRSRAPRRASTSR